MCFTCSGRRRKEAKGEGYKLRTLFQTKCFETRACAFPALISPFSIIDVQFLVDPSEEIKVTGSPQTFGSTYKGFVLTTCVKVLLGAWKCLLTEGSRSAFNAVNYNPWSLFYGVLLMDVSLFYRCSPDVLTVGQIRCRRGKMLLLYVGSFFNVFVLCNNYFPTCCFLHGSLFIVAINFIVRSTNQSDFVPH